MRLPSRAGLLARFTFLIFAVALLIPAAASAAMSNPSFESGTPNSADITNWTTSIVAPDGNANAGSCSTPQRGVCLIEGNDTFMVTDSTGTREVSISPLDGMRMVRLGGPFNDNGQNQVKDEKYRIDQSFMVDASDPVVKMNYRINTFDYTGFDELTLRITFFDANGAVLAERQTGSFGAGGDTNYKDSGWRGFKQNLADYAGQQVHMRVQAGGTQDELYGFWVYLDGGDAPAPPDIGASAPSGVELGEFIDEGTGLTYFTIPNSQAATFPDGCVPLTITVPISAGSGTVSNVKLLVEPLDGGSLGEIPMEDVGGGNWRATIPCAQDSNLRVSYTVTEGGETQTFVVPIGGVALIDPQGIVYDELQYNRAIREGKSPDQARAEAAISGASVKLQRFDGSSFKTVLSGDPGIFPNVNPEVTGANGKFQWDVSDGKYRVVVSKDGYPVTTSREVDIPPPVLDLHVAMCQTGVDCNPPVTPAVVLKAGRCANVGVGTGGADLLTGTAFGDLINGGGGNDTINGLAGDDCLNGQRGNDRLFGGAGTDRLNGSTGRDRLSGGSGTDGLSGRAGRDRLIGGTGRDRLSGGSRGDRLSGGSGNDRLSGGSGNDSIKGGGGRNRYNGAAGNDRINSVNRKAETVRCGRGRRDFARANRRDRLIGCERIRRVR
jgi:hypothetical protein